jgi:hypothetical protein
MLMIVFNVAVVLPDQNSSIEAQVLCEKALSVDARRRGEHIGGHDNGFHHTVLQDQKKGKKNKKKLLEKAFKIMHSPCKDIDNLEKEDIQETLKVRKRILGTNHTLCKKEIDKGRTR